MASRNRAQNQKTFNFKSSGQSASSQFNYVDKIKFKKLIGIKTPIEFGRGRDGLFKMHSELKDQIRDNFRNLLQTNHGDRLGNYFYGANLSELTFELSAADVSQEASNRINFAVSKYMPFISIIDFNFFTDRVDNEHTAKLGISVIYDVPPAGITNQKIEVILRVAG